MSLNNKNIKELHYNISQFANINLLLINSGDKNISRLTNYDLPNFLNEIETSLSNKFLNQFCKCNKNTVLFFETDLGLKYMAFALYNDSKLNGCLLLGPYITSKVPSFNIQDLIIKNNISIASSINDFFKKMPILNSSKENFLNNAVFAILNSNEYKLNKISLNNLDEDNNESIDFALNDYEINIESVRYRYKTELQLLHYVSQGDEKKALESLTNTSMGIIDRLPDYPVRNLKNLTITLNTLFRKCVQDNNIDTYLIHLLSDKYAVKIENAKTLKELNTLTISMTKSYCNLVNEHTSKDYTSIVNSTLQFIKLNFKNDITLQCIANSLFVHPNYLASKFKKETGYTITEHLNNVRVKESKILLKTTNMSISELAYSVGYNDSKYFAKIFKKLNDITPSQYRANSKK